MRRPTLHTTPAKLAISATFLLASGFFLAVPSHVIAADMKWTSYLRAGPGWQFGVLDEISSDHPVTVQTCANGWCRVQSGRAQGYVRQDLLTNSPSPQVPKGTDHDCFSTTLNGYEGASHVRFCGK